MNNYQRYFMCCEKCFKNIGVRGTRAAKFWMDICAVALEKGYVLSKYDTPDLTLLEMLGFIKTTETDKYIIIHVNGHIFSDGQHMFCMKGGMHDEDM